MTQGTLETLEEEVVRLRAELGQARALIAELRAELDRLRNERADPPPFVKPNTSQSPKAKSQTNKQPRRKRAKEKTKTVPDGGILPLRRYSTR